MDVEAVLVCSGLSATVEVDAEVEVDGLTLGFMLRLARTFDIDCWLETLFDLISRYFLIVGVSGVVKLEISCQHRPVKGTLTDLSTLPGNNIL